MQPQIKARISVVDQASMPKVITVEGTEMSLRVHDTKLET